MAVAILLLAIGCTHEDTSLQYNKLVKAEMASGKRADSIFFGIYFGMPSKEFYLHCWNMNKKGLFTDGQNNSAVLYKLNHNELSHPASINFYPAFGTSGIYRMKATIEYDGWAPWNKKLYSNYLMPDVVKMLSKWYPGNPFIEMVDKEKGRKIFVKVDGNRRILVGLNDDRLVNLDYTDLLTEQKLEK